MKNVRAVAAIAVAAYLLLVLYDRFVLVELLARRVGLPLFLAIVEVAALIGTGFAARGLFLKKWIPADLDFARELLVGYPLFGAVCFLVGTLNVSSWSMGALLVIAAVGGTYAMMRQLETRPWRTDNLVCPDRQDCLSPIAIAVVIGCGALAAQAPPSSLDELAYHLAVPWTWVQEHRAVDLPLISHSYFPLGLESADLPLLAILGQSDGGIASHFGHLAASIAAIALLLRLTRGNALAAAAVIATPALALTAGWSLVDFPLVGICAALVLDEEKPGPALAAGLLTKYTFIPFALIVLVARRQWRGAIGGALLGSLFFVRNVLLTGNPIAPFFSAGAPHVSGYRGAYLSDYVFGGSFVDESLGASLLAACTLSVGTAMWLLVGVGVVLFFLAPSARVLIPYFAIPAARSQAPGRVMRVLLMIAIAVQLLLVVWFVDRSKAFTLISAEASDEEYLAKARPSITTIAALDAALPASSRTLVVGLGETFWFKHRVRGGGNFDGPRVSRYLTAPTAEALYNRLRGDGITHVVVFAPGQPPTKDEKKLEERSGALEPDAQRALALMLDHFAASVESRGAATLFSLR